MQDSQPRFLFDFSAIIGKARRHIDTRLDAVTISIPFISFSVRPDEVERKTAQEVVIGLADQRVLNVYECGDSCVRQAIASLREIRTLLVDKQVGLSSHVDGGLYLILEMMLGSIGQFSTFEEGLRAANLEFPGDFHTRLLSHDLQPYLTALEMLRGHLYRSLAQVAIIANIKIPTISAHMRYEEAWELSDYKRPKLIGKKHIAQIKKLNGDSQRLS